jgi:hypothetical protein
MTPVRWIALAALVLVSALGVTTAVVLSDAELYSDTGPRPTLPTDTVPVTTTVEETTTEETTTAPVGPDPLFEEIDRALAALAPASVVFASPKELRVGESAVIQMLLSLKKPVDELQAELTEIGETEGARVRVSSLVEARLTGSGFTIEALTSERQPVSPGSDAEWRWEIEGAEGGRHRLHLTVSALISVRGERTVRAIRTLDRTIDIHVTWGQRISGFIGGNWQWIWAAILVPLAGVLWGAWRRRRREPTTL